MLGYDLHFIELYNYQPLKSNAFCYLPPSSWKARSAFICKHFTEQYRAASSVAGIPESLYARHVQSLIKNWWCFWVTYLANIYMLNEILIKSSSLSLSHQKNVCFLHSVSLNFHSIAFYTKDIFHLCFWSSLKYLFKRTLRVIYLQQHRKAHYNSNSNWANIYHFLVNGFF